MLSGTKVILWKKYVSHADAHWLYLAQRKIKNKISLIQDMRFLSILFHLLTFEVLY